VLVAVFYSHCDKFVVRGLLRSVHNEQSAFLRHKNHFYLRAARHEQLAKPVDLHAIQQGIPLRIQPDAVQE